MSEPASGYYDQCHPQVAHAHLRRVRQALQDPTWAVRAWPWYSSKPYMAIGSQELLRRAKVLMEACTVPNCQECNPPTELEEVWPSLATQ